MTEDSPAARTATLDIASLVVGRLHNNAYLLTCSTTGQRLLVDAADEPERLLAWLGPEPLAGIVTTHRHWDHWNGLAQVVAATGAPTYAGLDDADAIDVPTDVRLAHGQGLRVGEVELAVIALRGHTPGSIALLHTSGDDVVLLTGDSLFPGGPGNTDRDPARFSSLMDDLEQRVFGPLPDRTVVLPGHGAGTTLGAERPSLTQWRLRGW